MRREELFLFIITVVLYYIVSGAFYSSLLLIKYSLTVWKLWLFNLELKIFLDKWSFILLLNYTTQIQPSLLRTTKRNL